jgi:energy-coupling factor transport system ATP-binding protein
MGQGRILADGPTAEVFKQTELLAQTFLEPPQITQLAQRVQDLGYNPGTLTVESMVAQHIALRARQDNP